VEGTRNWRKLLGEELLVKIERIKGDEIGEAFGKYGRTKERHKVFGSES
jgi:hypothetical protein